MSLSGFDTGRVGLSPAKAKPRLPPPRSAERGKSRCIVADRIEQVGRHEMGVAIDDHSVFLSGFPQRHRIAEIRRDQRKHVETKYRAACIASLTALAIAAGAPR